MASAEHVLDAGARCDRCGAQAYMRAVFPDGTDLLFCGHHGREYAPVLAARGVSMVDETERLTPQPATA
ncbi:MAG TPA: hypothetical protein VHE83_19395 [Mycobacteriales bacterium]|nr:hypothetical protein [Mycobacteriales bacterium]